jgi:hypothetical protein
MPENHGFTPGPYRVEGTTRTWVMAGNRIICHCTDAASQPQREANARLFAAAPALYGALLEFVNWCQLNPFGLTDTEKLMLRRAEAALALVEGDHAQAH